MKIICFGDSNTWGYDPRGFFGGRYDCPWPEILAAKLGCVVVNQGQNGREIPAEVLTVHSDADLLMVMLGTNDLLQGASPEEICAGMERFLHAADPEKVLLIAPPPMKPGLWVADGKIIADSEELAIRCRALARRLGIRFADAGAWNVPLAFDGVHFTQDGHRRFADGLSKELENEIFRIPILT